ncbi:MAG: hypothetical protein IJ911_03685 [Salinivirgaceae bacterium]|nr:hypothetical protein [Salinivirgaceae bacterium]
METKEELLRMGESLLMRFNCEPERLPNGKPIIGVNIETFIGSEYQYYTFMQKTRKYVLDNNINSTEDFDIHCRLKPNKTSLSKALAILKAY